MSNLKKADGKRKYMKLALCGPPGTLKTRTALAFPHPAVIDMESGTDHYCDEFDFMVHRTTNAREANDTIKEVRDNPGDRETLVIDSWTVYTESNTSEFADLFLAKEMKSAGHKGEYYRLQISDYAPITRQMNKVLKVLMNMNMHVIATMHMKPKWKGMEVVGETSDGFKKTTHMFDTVIYLSKVKDAKTKKYFITGRVMKDRTGSFKEGESLDHFGIDLLHKRMPKYFKAKAEASVADEDIDVADAGKIVSDAVTQELAETPQVVNNSVIIEVPTKADAEKIHKEEIQPERKPDAEHVDPVTKKEITRADEENALVGALAMLSVPKKTWQTILSNRECTKIGDLTSKQMIEILAKLENKMSPDQLGEYLNKFPFRSPFKSV